MKEQSKGSLPGITTLLVLGAVVLLSIGFFIASARDFDGSGMLVAGLLILTCVACLPGFFMVEPNQAAVLSLFGKYVGTVKEQGLRFNNPFFKARKVSLRIRNFESGKLKVNELEGSPIEIASVVVWKVVDSAEAVYNVDDYESLCTFRPRRHCGRWRPAIRMTRAIIPMRASRRSPCAATPMRFPMTSSGSSLSA